MMSHYTLLPTRYGLNVRTHRISTLHILVDLFTRDQSLFIYLYLLSQATQTMVQD